MAYADRMHFSKAEYIEIKKLWLKTRKKQKRELGNEIWMYPFSMLEKHKIKEDGATDFDNYEYQYDPSESNLDIEWMNDTENDYTVFNVSTRVELWLLKNFKLPCIEREVKNQLSSFFYQDILEELQFNFTNELDFSTPDLLISIKHRKKDISIWLFREIDNNNRIQTIQTIDKILLYGTNDLFRILDEVNKEIYGTNSIKYGYEVQFQYCGLRLKLKNGKIYYGKKRIVIPFLKPNFKPLKIKHSYSKKEAEKYKRDEVFICTDKMCTDLTSWGGDDIKLDRILFSLPDYLKEQIK